MQPERPDDLERQLSAAGSTARRSDPRPDAAFAAGLREELLAQLPTEAPARGPLTRWGFRLPGFVPLASAAVLIVAGAVAARGVYEAVGHQPSPAPSVAPFESPGPSGVEPSFVPDASVNGEATPSGSPSPTSTPEPTLKPTPEPTPAVGSLNLDAASCPGGVVLDWSPWEVAGFDHYLTVRSTSSSMSGAVDPGGTYSASVGKTSAVDVLGEGIAAEVAYYYRTTAFNADGGVLARSGVSSAMAKPVRSLGELAVGSVTDGTKLAWSSFGGPGACFTWYKLVYSETNPSPSYLGGDPYLAALENQGASSFVTPSGAEGLISGHTYYLRVQVIRATDLGAFLVAQTSVTTFTVP